jgi:predicted RNA-binding protein with TRAM domain
MSFEKSSAAVDTTPVAQGEIRELSLSELTAVSGGFIVLIESVAPPPVSNGVLLSE